MNKIAQNSFDKSLQANIYCAPKCIKSKKNKMNPITPIEKQHGRYLPWAVGSAAFLGLAGTLWAHSSLPNKEAVDVLYEYDGLAGQNNQDPRSRFSNHGLVFWESHIYDPSYGVKLGGAAFTREQALFLWSKHVIAGFCNTRVPVLQIQGEEYLRCRIYTKESLELVVEE